MAEQDIKKGLAGVVVDYTAVSKVNPDTNSLLYRGYPVQELAAKCSFEEVAYLLWNGELPTAEQLAEFSARERAGRALDPVVKQVIDALPTTVASHGCLPDGGLGDGGAASAGGGLLAGGQPGQGRSTCSRRCRPSWPTTSAAVAARTWWSPARISDTTPTSSG